MSGYIMKLYVLQCLINETHNNFILQKFCVSKIGQYTFGFEKNYTLWQFNL